MQHARVKTVKSGVQAPAGPLLPRCEMATKNQELLDRIARERWERWGDVNGVTAAKYVEGIATEAECKEVEDAMKQHPSFCKAMQELLDKRGKQ